MSSNARSRLARLETRIRPIRGCDDCINQVGTVRLVTIDAAGTERKATRPTHCPVCGTDLAPDPSRPWNVRLVGVDIDLL